MLHLINVLCTLIDIIVFDKYIILYNLFFYVRIKNWKKNNIYIYIILNQLKK